MLTQSLMAAVEDTTDGSFAWSTPEVFWLLRNKKHWEGARYEHCQL